MSRHTLLKGSISRSLGVDGNEDTVVEIRDDRTVVIRKEPTDRRLGRGEKLPEVVIDVDDAWEKGNAASNAEAKVDQLLSALHTADFSGQTPEKIEYKMRVWLINKLKNGN